MKRANCPHRTCDDPGQHLTEIAGANNGLY